ncbi:MAG: SDR family oxidoreductase [Bacillota bacterium]
MELSGNTVLITGGSSGIGFALAEAFLAAGSKVLICGRSEKRLREARSKHPQFHIRVCDVSKPEDRQALLAWTKDHFPDLNVLVNNAGIQRDIDLTRGPDEFLAGENEIRVNLEAPVLLSAMFAPVLAGKKGAALINVSSGLGFVQAAGMPVYSASKAGMHGFCMAIRKQFEAIGVRVFEVVPPAVDTNLNPEGRRKRGNFKAGLNPREFVAGVMQGLKYDTPEIGFGMTAAFIHASRADLNRRFEQMNSRM